MEISRTTSIWAINGFSLLTVFIVFSISISAMTGWITDQPALYRLSEDFPALVPRTAIFLFLLSSATLTYLFTSCKISQLAGSLLILLTILCSISALMSYTSGTTQPLPISWGTSLLQSLQLSSLVSSPHTAINTLLLSLALLMVRLPTSKLSLLTDLFIFAVIAFTTFILFAYSYQITSMYSFSDEIGMSLLTATAFYLLAWGILFKHTQPLTYSSILLLPFSTGNLLIRGGLIGIILIPILLAWVPLMPLFSSTSYAVINAVMSTIIILLLAFSSIQLSFYLNQHEARQAKANRKISETQQQLSHISRVHSLGEMTSGIAHELNQPLSVINNYITGCEKQQIQIKSPKIAEAFHHIKTQVSRINSIINALRAMVKKSPPNYQTIKIQTVLADLLPLLKPELNARNIQLNYTLPKNLPSITADAIQLQQVFLNLIQNAMDAVENTPIERKHIEIKGSGHEKKYLKIQVSDQGIGMTENQLTQLFQPFITNKPEKGIGIGLSLVRSIIEAHCGYIDVKSEFGKGTTFTLKLPINKQC